MSRSDHPTRVLVVAQSHPLAGPGGTEIAAYELFRSLRARPDVQATFLACVTRLHRESRAEGLLQGVEGAPDELLLCERACDDEAICPCADPDQAGGIGIIMVVSDAFAADPTLDDAGNVFGVATDGAVGYGPTEQVPPHPDLVGKFPDGIHEGVRPYVLVPDGGFVDLGFTDGTEGFELDVCPTEAGCGLDFPELT